jgi:hypothetical protein
MQLRLMQDNFVQRVSSGLLPGRQTRAPGNVSLKQRRARGPRSCPLAHVCTQHARTQKADRHYAEGRWTGGVQDGHVRSSRISNCQRAESIG